MQFPPTWRGPWNSSAHSARWHNPAAGSVAFCAMPQLKKSAPLVNPFSPKRLVASAHAVLFGLRCALNLPRRSSPLLGGGPYGAWGRPGSPAARLVSRVRLFTRQSASKCRARIWLKQSRFRQMRHLPSGQGHRQCRACGGAGWLRHLPRV